MRASTQLFSAFMLSAMMVFPSPVLGEDHAPDPELRTYFVRAGIDDQVLIQRSVTVPAEGERVSQSWTGDLAETCLDEDGAERRGWRNRAVVIDIEPTERYMHSGEERPAIFIKASYSDARGMPGGLETPSCQAYVQSTLWSEVSRVVQPGFNDMLILTADEGFYLEVTPQ